MRNTIEPPDIDGRIKQHRQLHSNTNDDTFRGENFIQNKYRAEEPLGNVSLNDFINCGGNLQQLTNMIMNGGQNGFFVGGETLPGTGT